MVHNENNRAFIISGKGISRMDFHYQWEHEEAPKRGLRNPWKYRPDKPLRWEKFNDEFGVPVLRCDYPEVDAEIMEAWKKERDEYMRQRDEWIALQMFHEYGYETFLEECDAYSSVKEDFKKTIFPCESYNESQCNMYCPIFNDCAIRKGDEEA